MPDFGVQYMGKKSQRQAIVQRQEQCMQKVENLARKGGNTKCELRLSGKGESGGHSVLKEAGCFCLLHLLPSL